MGQERDNITGAIETLKEGVRLMFLDAAEGRCSNEEARGYLQSTGKQLRELYEEIERWDKEHGTASWTEPQK
jgi:hypothetical protein